ncbi:MAG TPA: C25 family cysteine peptidase [Actinomycetota bacterium]
MTDGPRAWVLAASTDASRALRPLIAAHERERPVRVVTTDGAADHAVLGEHLEGAEACLLVGERRRSPRGALPGPFLAAPGGRLVPAGWLPDAGENLGGFAEAAARVLARGEEAGPVAVLAQWHQRYLRLADRMEANLAGTRFPVLRWSAERITRDDVADALGLGIGLAVYFGHGRPSGWAGYRGMRAHHLAGRDEPIGAVISATCRTASRWRTGMSFSERLVLEGAAASSVGAVVPVEHLENMRWMLGLAAALRAGERRIGRVLLHAAPPGVAAGSAYRIIGDPLAPVAGTRVGARRAQEVWAPAPDEPIEGRAPAFA